LATTDDARVHCAVLKVRAVPVRPAVLRFGPGPVQGKPADAAVPSGPNSVLGLVNPPDPRSVPLAPCGAR